MGVCLRAAVPIRTSGCPRAAHQAATATVSFRVGAPLGFRRLVVRAGNAGLGEVVGGFAAALRAGLEDVPFPQPHHRPVRAVLDAHDRRAGGERVVEETLVGRGQAAPA